MVNPIKGIGNIENYQYTERKSQKVRKQNRISRNGDGVIIEISLDRESLEELSASEKAKRIKNLIKEGKYPIDLQKLSEKIVDFFTNV